MAVLGTDVALFDEAGGAVGPGGGRGGCSEDRWQKSKKEINGEEGICESLRHSLYIYL